ncbi:MAG: hypothetical protein JWO30_4129 [Fibrobacteres bacterium]|nr:hypothetical protein [Fibrobacterota bacterium]
MIKSRLQQCNPLIPLLLAAGVFIAPASAQLALSASQAVQIYASSTPVADAVCATLKKDANNIFLFRSTWNATYKYYGPLTDPQHTRVTGSTVQNKDIFTIPSALQSKVVVASSPLPTVSAIPAYKCVNFYLKNVYDLGGGKLLGFLHLEYMAWNRNSNGTYTPGYDPTLGGADHYSIGLAYSTNSGDSWTFCGDIIRTQDKTVNLGSANIGGAAYIVVGSNIYVYFNEKSTSSTSPYPSVAMAKISDVATEAVNHTVTPWKKYNAATKAFDQDAITGVGSQIIAGVALDMHTDAAYCAALKQYLIVVSENVTQSLYLYRSRNGIDWAKSRFLAQSYVGSDGYVHQPCYPYFASLNSDANSDNSTVGKAFSIFYISQHFANNMVPSDEPVWRVNFKVSDMLPIANMLK